jgi:hypothetical protein
MADSFITTICMNQCTDAQFLAEIRAVLDRILPGTDDHRDAFARAAMEAITTYHDDSKRKLRDDARAFETLTGFINAAGRLVDQMRSLQACKPAIDLLDIGYLTAKQRRATDDLEDLKMLSAAVDSIERGTAIVAAVMEGARKDDPHRGNRPNRKAGDDACQPVDAAIYSLCSSLAVSYAAIIGERPSAAELGTFAKVISIVFAAAGINAAMGEHRLAKVIGRVNIGKAPRRGQKKRG